MSEYLRFYSADLPLPIRRILWNSKIVQSPPLIHYDSILPSAVGDEEAERGVLEWLDKVVGS